MIDWVYWKSAIVNQTAHFGVGVAVAFVGAHIGLPPDAVLFGLFVAAWARELAQFNWRVGYALRKWRKWNDVAWFMIGALLMQWALGLI